MDDQNARRRIRGGHVGVRGGGDVLSGVESDAQTLEAAADLCPQIRGMLHKVQHLVTWEEVDEKDVEVAVLEIDGSISVVPTSAPTYQIRHPARFLKRQ